jgi:hypothetical protein
MMPSLESVKPAGNKLLPAMLHVMGASPVALSCLLYGTSFDPYGKVPEVIVGGTPSAYAEIPVSGRSASVIAAARNIASNFLFFCACFSHCFPLSFILLNQPQI